MVAYFLECLVIFHFKLTFFEMEFYLLGLFKALFKAFLQRGFAFDSASSLQAQSPGTL